MFSHRCRTTKIVAPGCAMMGFTVMVWVVSSAQLRIAVLDNIVPVVLMHRIHLASAAAMGPVIPHMLGVAPPSTPTIAPSSVIRAIS